MHPLKQAENSHLLDMETVDEIFFMVPSILQIHENYLVELSKILDEWEHVQCIGNPFFAFVRRTSVLYPKIPRNFLLVFESDDNRNLLSVRK